MAQDPMTKTAADFDALVAQIAALRGDLTQMAQELQKTATANGKAMVQELGAEANWAAKYLGSRGQEAEHAVESAVERNPWLALGLAAGVGLMLGALTRR